MARGILNSIAIDNDGEDYRFENFSTTGVKDIIDSTCNMLSAVTNIPQTVLFGRSPAGENSTGKSDLENYYNMVENIQKQNMKANARTVIDLILRQGVYEGRIAEAPKYKVKFAALWSMSDTEQAEVSQKRAQVEQTKAQTIAAYLEQGVLDPEEVRRGLARKGPIEVEEIISEQDLASEDETLDIPEGTLPTSSPTAENVEAADSGSGERDSETAVEPEYEAAAVLVIKDGKALCAARRDQQGLCGPGGHLKPGESPEDAALRESQEEFNIVPLSLIPFGELQATTGRYLRTKLYFADRFTGTPEADGMELIDERWVRIDELHKEPLFPAFEESLKLFCETLRPFAKRHEYQADGSSGSGNWGHKGVPGQLGGSAPGGGVAHRTGSKETGYSSAAKEKAKAKSSSSATSGGSSSSAGGKKSGESSGGSSSRMSVSELQERHFTAIEKMAVSNDGAANLFLAMNGTSPDKLNALMQSGKLVDEAKAVVGKKYEALGERYSQCPESQKRLMEMKPEEVGSYIDSCYSKAVDSSLNAGSKTQHVVADMGLDGKPTILGKKEFERAVAESESGTIYRGVQSTEHMSAEAICNMTLHGERQYIGDGMHGDGTYFSTKQSTATSFAGNSFAIELGMGKTMTACLSKKARIADEDDLLQVKTDYHISDTATAALYMGYNTIKVSLSGETYFVTLDREALVFLDEHKDSSDVESSVNGKELAKAYNAFATEHESGNNHDNFANSLDISGKSGSIKGVSQKKRTKSKA